MSGVGPGEVISSEVAKFEILLKHGTPRTCTIWAVVIPREKGWMATIPRHKPSWLKQLVEFLADPGVASDKEQLEYDMLVGGSYLAALKLEAVWFVHLFAMQTLLAGLVPQGTWKEEYEEKSVQSSKIRSLVRKAKKSTELLVGRAEMPEDLQM